MIFKKHGVVFMYNEIMTKQNHGTQAISEKDNSIFPTLSENKVRVKQSISILDK